MASFMTSWSIKRSPAQRRHCQHDDLIPQELDARRGAGDTRIERPVAADGGLRCRASGTSPSATATPSAEAPRDSAIEWYVSSVAAVARRRAASRCALWVSSGHLISRNVRSAGDAMPRPAMAAATASAVAAICGHGRSLPREDPVSGRRRWPGACPVAASDALRGRTPEDEATVRPRPPGHDNRDPLVDLGGRASELFRSSIFSARLA